MAVVVALAAAVPMGAARSAPRVFRLDDAASRLVVLLTREGAFSAFSHDHVLVARGLEGEVTLDVENPSAAALRLTLPVERMVVDAPGDREREGLAGTLTKSQRGEVRENMLGPQQLDAAAFPAVTAFSAGVAGDLPRLRLQLRLGIRGVERVVPVEARVTLENGLLAAEGEAEVRQTDFSIRPFRLLLGVVAVADVVRVRFRIVARETP